MEPTDEAAPPKGTPEWRTWRARLAAQAKWAQCDDRAEATRPAREKFMANADSDHFKWMGQQSGRARRKAAR